MRRHVVRLMDKKTATVKDKVRDSEKKKRGRVNPLESVHEDVRPRNQKRPYVVAHKATKAGRSTPLGTARTKGISTKEYVVYHDSGPAFDEFFSTSSISILHRHLLFNDLGELCPWIASLSREEAAALGVQFLLVHPTYVQTAEWYMSHKPALKDEDVEMMNRKRSFVCLPNDTEIGLLFAAVYGDARKGNSTSSVLRGRYSIESASSIHVSIDSAGKRVEKVETRGDEHTKKIEDKRITRSMTKRTHDDIAVDPTSANYYVVLDSRGAAFHEFYSAPSVASVQRRVLRDYLPELLIWLTNGSQSELRGIAADDIKSMSLTIHNSHNLPDGCFTLLARLSDKYIHSLFNAAFGPSGMTSGAQTIQLTAILIENLD